MLTACADKDPQQAVAALLPDPASARFQAVSDRGSHVCGEVNGKAPRGGYTGYARFVFEKGSGRASLDPRLERQPRPARVSDAACAKPVSYQTVDERLSCAEAGPSRPAGDLQADFEALWRRSCG